MDGRREVDLFVVVHLDHRCTYGFEEPLHRQTLLGGHLGGNEADGRPFADRNRCVRHNPHDRAMGAVPLDVREWDTRSDRNEHAACWQSATQALGHRRHVLWLHGQQHEVRSDTGALRVVRHPDAMLREREVSSRHLLRNRDVTRARESRAHDPAQEGLAHEAAADDADPHSNASRRARVAQTRGPKRARPTRTTVAPSSIATA